MMPILNHIISFANVPNIDRYLEKCKKAGFHVNQQTVRHAPGKRNGFVNFGPDYIEFFWVEDTKLFDRKAAAYQKFFRDNPRPFGVAWESKSVDAFHKSAVRKGFELKPTWSKAMKEAADEKPWWAFQDIPKKYLPGMWSFMLTYLRRDWKKARTVSIPPNTIYGLTGITFITNKPEARARSFQKFLGGKRAGSAVVLGPHTLKWSTAEAYEKTYGAVKSPRYSGSFDGIQDVALIHLVATDLKKAENMLSSAGFKLSRSENGFFIKPDKRDGFAFHVTEMLPKRWLKTRAGFGQKIKFM